jgi:lipopolysaccharide/colanic/teichoic acid biosynthesis glycosyltransferase
MSRIYDIIVTTLLLIVLSPILVVIAILLSFTGRIIFKQDRIGLNGKPFQIYKFRTMVEDAEILKDDLLDTNEQDGCAFKIVNDPRVTRLGKILRQFSLDELPQFFNVLRGEMAIVGPRPLPLRDWSPEKDWYNLRHNVKPGLTCLWQVNGRSLVDFDTWMLMDMEYLEKRSFWLDMRIILKTIPAILSRSGT